MKKNQPTAPPPRRVSCARCGAPFECGLSGECWCAQEEFRLPLPETSEDCFCPACLRKAAQSMYKAQR